MKDQDVLLKNCPFCGYAESLVLRPERLEALSLKTVEGYARMCGQCGTRTVTCETEERMNERWNSRAPSEWIPVSERLPERFCPVDVTMVHIHYPRDFYVGRCAVDVQRWFYCDEIGQEDATLGDNERVLFWKPRVAPHKPEDAP